MALSLERNQLKYHQVKAKIESLIQSLEPGTKIPSERDLAKQYGCNSLTVHKALALLVNEGRIAKRTGAGTFVADPQMASQALRHIGILLHTRSDTYALRLTGYLAELAAQRNLTLHTKMIQDFGDGAIQAMQQLTEDQCGALIVPWFLWEQVPQMLAFVRKAPLPVTLPALFQGYEDHCFDHVTVFGQAAIRYTDLAGQYFKRLGYGHIAFIGPVSPSNDVLHRKIIGYTNFIGLGGMDNLCHLVTSDIPAMDKVARRLKEYKGDLAVISYDDQHAIRFLTAMHKIGMQAPDDYAIIGYNNTESAAACDPPMSCLYGDSLGTAGYMLDHAQGMAQGKVVQTSDTHRLYFKVRQSCSGTLRMGEKLADLLGELQLLDGPVTSGVTV
jgi:DNA-binding transcriptional regulator YhcF (GntR family)